MYQYLLILIVILFIINTNNQFDNMVENMMPLSDYPETNERRYEEITNLRKCCPEIYPSFYNNTSNIYNDGLKIFMDVIQYPRNNIILNGHRYGLSRLEYHISYRKWHSKPVGLEFHTIFSRTQDNKQVKIIFPLSLTDTADFNNLFNDNGITQKYVEYEEEKNDELDNYAKIPKEDKKKEINDNTEFSNIKKQTDKKTIEKIKPNKYLELFNSYDIPQYICCSPNQGKMINVDLCPIADLINKQKYFYINRISKQTTYFISRPIPFDRTKGFDIRSKLIN